MGCLVTNNGLGKRPLHQLAQKKSKISNDRSFCDLYPSRGTQSPKTHRTIGCRHGQQGHVKPGNVLSVQQPPWSKNNRRHHHQPFRLRNHLFLQKIRPKGESPKAATTQLLLHLYTCSSSIFVKIIANLWCGAFFFACQSCQYSQTQGTHKTITLTPCNIVFPQHVLRRPFRIWSHPIAFCSSHALLTIVSISESK